MKIEKEHIQPEVRKMITDYYICDLCGDKSENKWDEYSNYTVSKVRVQHEKGSQCSDGGSGEHIKYDICPKCFTEKLTPWLESQGAKPRIDEWDW